MLQAGDVLHMVIFSGQKKIIMYLLKSALHLSGGGGGGLLLGYRKIWIIYFLIWAFLILSSLWVHTKRHIDGLK